MTDNEIIKALERCTNYEGVGSCVDCPLANYTFEECADILRHKTFDLINRQQAEIDRYKGVIKILEKDVAAARNEGAKEFAKRIEGVVSIPHTQRKYYDEIKKEMAGDI